MYTRSYECTKAWPRRQTPYFTHIEHWAGETGRTTHEHMFDWRGTLMFQINSLITHISPFSPTELCDCCSSSLPQTQSTVVLIKSCAALHTFSPMVILGHSQCECCCKPPHQPIRVSISPHRASVRSFLSISCICLNTGLEFDCEMCLAIAGPHMGGKVSLKQ